MTRVQTAVLWLLTCFTLGAQSAKDIRELGRGGSGNMPKLQELLKSPDLDTRIEAVKAVIEIGTQYSLDPLIQATTDNDPEVQIRATDGLVDFYLPGYVKTGLSASLRRAGNTLKSKFTDTNDLIVPPHVQARPDVIAALGKLARGGSNMDSRANAARALGILRGQAAVPDLLEALRSKDTSVIYESLVAFQKIRDESVAPKIGFLLRDLNPRVQIAAIETTGLLQNKEALPNLLDVFKRTRDTKVRRAALAAMAMLPDEGSRSIYAAYLNDKDDRLRGAAAEGLGRLGNKADAAALETAFEEEKKSSPRLSEAFALVKLGRRELTEFSPLQYLINTLNSSSWRGEAYPLLIELARDPGVRALLYTALPQGTKDEKIYLARTLAVSGDNGSIEPLEKLSRDGDPEVAQEAVRALQSVKARR